jgi:hypothetical protein
VCVVPQALSPTVFEALLSSKGLQLKTANEAFWLLLAWLEAQSEESEEGKQELFTRMAKHLSFAAMDPGYILLLVSEHPRIIAAGLQHKVMRASLIHSNLARRTSGDIGLVAQQKTLDRLPAELPGGKPEWTFDVKFTTAEAAAIKPGERYSKIVGLAAGLPWQVDLERRNGELKGGARERDGAAGVYNQYSLPFTWMRFEDGSGFYFRYKLEVGVGAPRESSRVKRVWSGVSTFGKSLTAWEEVFREGSEWLVNGELRVRVTVATVNDQGP